MIDFLKRIFSCKSGKKENNSTESDSENSSKKVN